MAAFQPNPLALALALVLLSSCLLTSAFKGVPSPLRFRVSEISIDISTGISTTSPQPLVLQSYSYGPRKQKQRQGLQAIKVERELEPDTTKPQKKGTGLGSTPAGKEELSNNEDDQLPLYRGLILLVTVLWATNFAVIKEIYNAVPALDPSLYSALRFSFAGLFFLPSALSRIKNLELAVSAFFVGVFISIGYVGQGIGLETSTSDKAAFICTLQVVWVALISSVKNKEFKLQTWVSVALALVGTFTIEICGSVQPNWGDAWLMLQPLGFGTGYLLLENVINKFPEEAEAITGFKLSGIAACMVGWAASNGHSPEDVAPILDSPIAMGGLAYTGAITTALAIWLQSLAFKQVSAQEASIIIASEPAWAVLVSFLLLGDTLTNNEIAGGLLIIVAGLSYEFDLTDRIRRSMNKEAEG